MKGNKNSLRLSKRKLITTLLIPTYKAYKTIHKSIYSKEKLLQMSKIEIIKLIRDIFAYITSILQF